MQEDDDNQEYICLINDEEQYSLWFAWKKIPEGWRQVGPKGSKKVCGEYIQKVWTDMRPKSLRMEMERLSSKKANENA